MQPIDQDIYSEWDPAAQSEWSRAQVRGAGAWQRERDETWQEIHFLQRNMELLLACTEAAEQNCQDPPQLPPQPPEGERLVLAPPNDGLTGPQPRQAPQRRRLLKACFDGTMEKLAYFLILVEAHIEKHGSDYEDEVEQFPHFMLALRQQFEDPFEEKARVRLRQIRQGSRSVSEYVSEFCQVAGVVQDCLRQVKFHFFQEGLHPEVAQWAMVTAEPTYLAGWYTRAGEVEVLLRRVQLLKQWGNPPPASPHPLLEGISPAHADKEARELLYAQRRQLGLCLSCRSEGHKAALCPSKKADSPVVPAQ
uniref:Uncharacterized protein n=1 Tax=Sphaerodactylus townsendi TaxID=933632 RepID=A0ACB8F0U8_9SAUR